MHEARAVAEILRTAESAAAGRRLKRLAIRLEGEDDLITGCERN